MAQDKDAVDFKEDVPAGKDSRAEWHPYSVWREQIRSEETPETQEPQQNIELTGSWKPLSVWERHIKRA